MAADTFTQQSETGQEKIELFGFVLLAIFSVSAVVFLLLTGPRGSEREAAFDLDSRINPNFASVASLARLPGIGRARAEAIVTYRESLRENRAGEKAFEDLNDLQKVRGIGPKTAGNIAKWVKFD